MDVDDGVELAYIKSCNSVNVESVGNEESFCSVESFEICSFNSKTIPEIIEKELLLSMVF